MIKRLGVNAAIAVASIVVALVLGEGALRVAGFSYPNFWTPDPVTGTALRPGMEGWQREEGSAYIKVNSQGLRDREHKVAKADGTYRIAVLGDSYAEALQVDIERTFWSLAADKLQACGFARGKKIEVINFGVSGYGTAHELLTLRTKAWAYQPDMVLLAFFPGNDVRNNSRALEGEAGRAYFSLKDGKLFLDGALKDDPDFQEKQRLAVQRQALQDLRLYQLVRRVKAGNIGQVRKAPIAAAVAAGNPLTEPGLDEQVFRAPADAKWREAWEITDRLVVTMHEEIRNKGARFLLAVLSTPGSVFPDPEVRGRYARTLGVETLFYPEERLQRLGEEHGFEVMALAPEMQRRAEAGRVYLHGFPNTKPGFGHWNEAGHAMAAELIAARLCRKP